MTTEFADQPSDAHAPAGCADEAAAEDDLEGAYRRALAAVEAAEREIDRAFVELADDAVCVDENENAEAPRDSEAADSIPMDAGKQADGEVATPDAAAGERRVDPRRIIEAALFVGGDPITTRKLRTLLRDEFDADFIERQVDALNGQYARDNRPYEIHFGEGGFRLALRDEHERLRNRVFGHAPKEVRLSQEALEILALVAYRQPLTRDEIETLGGTEPSGILRQLVRRELLSIERGDDAPQAVRYRTTSRFLQVFGLSSLEELPCAEDLEFK